MDDIIFYITLLSFIFLILTFSKNKKRENRDNIDIKNVSEYKLYCFIKEKYPKAEYQKRFSWLGKQSLDIYIPNKKVAIEYQGEQHFKPVKHFGGRKQFRKQKRLDKKKKMLCKKHNIKLLYFTYNQNTPKRLCGKKVYTDCFKLRKKIR